MPPNSDRTKALGDHLRQSGERILAEASPVDAIWDIGVAQDDVKAGNPQLWEGLNLLGFVLMKVRDTLARNCPGDA